MKHITSRFAPLLLVISLAVTAGCHRVKGPPQLKPSNDQWRSILSSHTSGLISRKSKILVTFNSEIFDNSQVGQELKGVLKTEPSIAGVPTITGPAEITWVPTNELQAGAYYKARLVASRLPRLPEKIGDYEFIFQVLSHDFSVEPEGLSSAGADGREWALPGVLTTADTEDADRVQKVLSAEMNGQKLPIEWTHDVSGKSHRFRVQGIHRTGSPGKLRLSADGGPLDVSRTTSQEIEIPAESDFKVVDVKSISGEDQTVVIYLSDVLNPRQNLKGLVRLGGHDYTSRVEGNQLKLFPQPRLAGQATLTIQPGLQNTQGRPLGKSFQKEIVFASQKPQVRFAGKGVILPDNNVLSIPIEAMNVRSVQVTAFRIYNKNVGQFLQTNKLNGEQELGRVGRFLWRRTIHLPALTPDQWQRYALDATSLLHDNPGGLFRLTLSIHRGNSAYGCAQADESQPVKTEDPLSNEESYGKTEASGWDGIESYVYEGNGQAQWQDRENPCKDSYYQLGQGVKESRNFLASNLGLLAKRDSTGALFMAVTHLKTAEPLSGVTLTVYNYQNQPMATVASDGDGFALLNLSAKPYYVEAAKGADKGYLRVDEGAELPTSHFDVGGERSQEGLKGFIYGERGVWRPVDKIFLTFVLEDKLHNVPDGHPAELRFFNPKGQLIDTLTNTQPVDGFYSFALKTAEDAPTGNWMAKVRLGNSEFTKTVKVETIMPNRLAIDLTTGKEELYIGSKNPPVRLHAQWLHGAPAGPLKADVSVSLSAIPTRFERFSDHIFDDPARDFKAEPQTVFEGRLNEDGAVSFPLEINTDKSAPGLLAAQLYVRVHEEEGAFSSMRKDVKLYPYQKFIGMKLPKGDQARNMLMTDQDHIVSLASLSAKGEPTSVKRVQVTLYKVEWRWWWDKSAAESLAQYATGTAASVIKQSIVSTQDGKGSWSFQVKYPEWGRYLIRACDLDGGHCTGQTFYIDWPGWAGRAQDQSGPGANVLVFSSDKTEYQVGEKAVIQLPEATQGRALFTLENGSRLLEKRWVTFSKGKTKIQLPITAAMAPNVYVSVSLIQPHSGKNNDRPIRVYGVIPLKVSDPKTHLQPVIKTAEEWKPSATTRIDVSEADGRPMTYTLAIVDEGLLSLTAFKTPDLHSYFYKKEALGVSMWDLFDDVVGAYGGELERLLALGGSDEGGKIQPEEKRRFPPVVQVLGPFQLKAGAHQEHTLTMTSYVGAVRVMVVAGKAGAYGLAEKSIPVRQPLMLLSTLPRVVGPEEEMGLPVSVFAMKEEVKDVTLRLATDDHFKVVGPSEISLKFAKVGEKTATFRVRSLSRLGAGTLSIEAVSGPHHARSTTHLTVRSPNPVTVRHITATVEAGKTWTEKWLPHGLPGTQQTELEVSSLPALHLERHLTYLLQYPHGCVEQTTSAVFPQLFLVNLVQLTKAQQADLEKNVRAGIDRLRQFQGPDGGFMYWPGVSAKGSEPWASNYAGHFLVEAEHQGYAVPSDMLVPWAQFQKTRAQAWTAGTAESALDQAYRLYTLALHNQADLSSMNRLRETPGLDNTARWHLAAAYEAAGVHEAGRDLMDHADLNVRTYADPGFTFGSSLRDRAIILNALATLQDFSKGKPLADAIAEDMGKARWYSTQETAYALMGLSRFYGASKDRPQMEFSYAVGGAGLQRVTSSKPLHQQKLEAFPAEGTEVKVQNSGSRRLFVTLLSRGVPAAGEEEAAAEGLTLSVAYPAAGGAGAASEITQGSAINALVTITNHTGRKLDNLALTAIAPSGWEIRNTRWEQGQEASTSKLDYQDVRDDRVLSYFSLNAGESLEVPLRFHAAYTGHFYLPATQVEAMYQGEVYARTAGRWIDIKK